MNFRMLYISSTPEILSRKNSARLFSILLCRRLSHVARRNSKNEHVLVSSTYDVTGENRTILIGIGTRGRIIANRGITRLILSPVDGGQFGESARCAVDRGSSQCDQLIIHAPHPGVLLPVLSRRPNRCEGVINSASVSGVELSGTN